ncbi:MAG: enoyl-CoA hydratase/isomerase family protein [Proteobacteria bacterium]|nr:enoyl-CoA hydratase/isomerase family protein [Pseudomonadota bacterium]
MTTIRYELAADGIATITHDAPGAPVNTMTVQWQADLAAVVERVEADKERIKGVLVTSAKKTFFAGAQLDSVLTMTEADAPAAFAAIEAMKRSFRRLETLGRPVVALLNGAALGGGWELALAAHARFALDNRTLRFGTPEVSLGLIPGATGITKTVRLLGLMAAQPLLMEGKLFGPREALELGLVDGIGSSVDDLREMALAWIAEHPQAQQPWDRKDYKMPGGTPASPKIAMGLTVAPAMLAAKSRGLYPAAQAILEAMVEGALVDYDTATRIESRKLAKIMTGQTARNMIQAFFYDLNAIKAGKARPQGFAAWKPKRVGVLGAGMMGAGIAQANASRGIPCVLEDVAIDKARQAAKHELVTPTADLADLKGCDLVIEAVFEQRALKAQVTREAEPLLAEGGIFASNTSTLPISGLAQASAAPQRFVGLHFFSPVHKMKLVEIIRGQATDDETVARAYDYVLALGKTPIVVNDSRGFFTSRVFGTFVMEGAAMLEEGIAAPLVEHAAEAAGMPVGPLAVLDETSLSLSVHVIEQTRADFAAEGRTREPAAGEALVERLVKEFGRAGRAAGGGFYDYPAGEPKRLWPGLKRFEKSGLASDFEELKQRFLYRQATETARCLAEGVLASVAEANIGSIFGIGFPAWTGGALQFVRSEGLANFERRADALAERHGERFALAPQVREALRRACT